MTITGAGARTTEIEASAHGNLGPYHWVSPPTQLSRNNQPPAAGHLTLKVVDAQTSAGGAATDDGQAQLGFERGGFSSLRDVTIDIEPKAQFPAQVAFQPATNVYLVRASAPLAKPATISLGISPEIAAPNVVFWADPGTTNWRPLLSTPFAQAGVGQLISAQLEHLPAYVVAASTISTSRKQGSGAAPPQSGLPLLAGILLLAAVPALLMGRIPLPGTRRSHKQSKNRKRAPSR